MATELRPTQGATLTRSERILEDQLLKVESQLRLLDIGVGVSGALVILFGYALGLMVVDRFLVLSSLARQAMFVGMCAGVVYWCYRKLASTDPTYQSGVCGSSFGKNHTGCEKQCYQLGGSERGKYSGKCSPCPG